MRFDLEEAALLEHCAAACLILRRRLDAVTDGAILPFPRRNQPCTRDEQRMEAVPVALLPGRTRDDVVNRLDDRIERGDILGTRGRWCCRRWLLRGQCADANQH